MAWNPPKGALCYIRHIPQVIEHFDHTNDTVVKHTISDSSFSDEVFRCLATDDTMLVVLRLYPTSKYSEEKPMTLNRRKWELLPVSPDVSKALGLQQETHDE